MATSITPATLLVTISEQINLNGQPIDSENQLTIENVAEYDKRIMTLPQGSEITIMQFASVNAAGQFIRGDMKYLRLTNKDATNYCRIRVKKTGADTFDIKLAAGKSFMMGNGNLFASDSAAAFTLFEDVDSISGQAYDSSIDIEYVVAST